MVTTSRLVSLDAVGSEGTDLIHLTGWLQVAARAATGGLPPGALICSPAPVQSNRVRTPDVSDPIYNIGLVHHPEWYETVELDGLVESRISHGNPAGSRW